MATMEERIHEAVTQHKDFVVDNLSTLTMKRFREMLEDHLQLPPKALRGYKDVVDSLVDKIVVEHTKTHPPVDEPDQDKDHETSAEKRVLKPHNASNTKKSTKKQEAAAKKEKGTGKKEQSSGEKRRRTEDAAEKPKKRQKSSQPKSAPAATGKSYDKAILKAKDVCKKAGINIPTVIYKKKGEDEILDAISALLEKHDLDRNSGRGEIAAARAKIQKAKDLEGIDTSNIVQGDRRSRQRTIDYSQAYKGPDVGLSDSEDEEDTPEPEEDQSDAMDSDEEVEDNDAPSKSKIRGKAKGRVSVDEDDAGESSDPQGDDDDASEGSEDAKDGVTPPSEDDAPEEDAKGIVSGKKTPRPSAKKDPRSGSMKERRSLSARKGSAAVKSESEHWDHNSDGKATRPGRKLADWSDSE